ncbi:MAG: hypothetical protein HY092_00535 [Candidatus Kerfeldbacteria bacterium]|nr:hypothetical protein [Candidatus Kerfeldbacteria bacterium]
MEAQVKVYSSHSTWVPGCRAFAEWLAKIPSVAYVNQGNVRGSHVRPGIREPVVEVTKHSVKVTFFASGQLQVLFVFPLSRISMEGLAKRIRNALSERQQRGGPGMSSKDDVPIPAHIERMRRMSPGKETMQEIIMTKLVHDGYLALAKFFDSDMEPNSIDDIRNELAKPCGKGNAGYVTKRLIEAKILRASGRNDEYLFHPHANIKVTVGRRRRAFTGPTAGRSRRVTGPPDDDIKTLIEQIKEAKQLIRDNIEKLKGLGGEVTLGEDDKVDVHFKI